MNRMLEPLIMTTLQDLKLCLQTWSKLRIRYLCTPFSMCSWTRVLAATSRGSDPSFTPKSCQPYSRLSGASQKDTSICDTTPYGEFFPNGSGGKEWQEFVTLKSRETWMKETSLPCSHFSASSRKKLQGLYTWRAYTKRKRRSYMCGGEVISITVDLCGVYSGGKPLFKI